ncbi:MAG: NAD(P)H-dependent oxidoreductase subunit E [Anaerolineae bacterium]|nr:NAD(P)H-dependent oxidoreductase subunit E [Anaerolineae bacterium]
MDSLSIAEILVPYQGRQRDALLPVLWDMQTAFGHIGPDAVRQISHTLHVPEADIYGVMSFYSLFSSEPTAKTVIRICTDPVCGLAGADEAIHNFCRRLNIHHDEITPDGKYAVSHTTCLGLCDHAPAALISQRGQSETAIAPLTPETDFSELLTLSPYQSIVRGDILLKGVDGGNVESLADYGNYRALHHAITILGPDGVIGEVEKSGLIGRGGAAFPTATKWKMTRQATGQPKYVVCNADESEPGTFKDRVLMEARPHLILEGVALCAFAIGATKAYLFVRGEYPESAWRLQRAIDEATHAGLLGANILGSEFSLDIEIRRGGGAYICGEETALFEAIEGNRGFPRIKPPYPTTHGLFQKPTVVNNVETLSTIPGIVEHGGDWFRQWGTEKSTGPKLVSVSGHVQRPGVYEINPGITLRQLLEGFCGGVIGDLQMVLMGGAAGTFLTPDQLDVRLTFEDLRAIRSTFGSGAIMVFNETADIRDILRRLGRFFKHESCGKCFPCQLGTQRQMEILERADTPLVGDRERLRDIGLTMTESSLCGLGQTAASAVLSALEKWPDLFAVKGQPV